MNRLRYRLAVIRANRLFRSAVRRSAHARRAAERVRALQTAGGVDSLRSATLPRTPGAGVKARAVGAILTSKHGRPLVYAFVGAALAGVLVGAALVALTAAPAGVVTHGG